MSYEEDGDKVTLKLNRADHAALLMMLGYALATIKSQNDPRQFYGAIQFVNDLNTGNPRFTPYEIPEEYRAKLEAKS